MSFPDMLRYVDRNLVFYTRFSEFEPYSLLTESAKGVWLDSFRRQWFDINVIDGILKKKKKVAIVSSELHGRNHETLWELIKEFNLHRNAMVSLCTDFPEVARDFFYD
jgi:hypothetical protein